MALITIDDVRSIPIFKGKGGERLFNALYKITALDKLTEVYDQHADKIGHEFSTSILEATGVDYLISGYERLKDLVSGPFITISNHPYGGVDGLILSDLVGGIREDYKIMVNKILTYLKAMGPVFIPVIPTGEKRTAPTKESVEGIKNCLLQIRDGHPLGIFPAGAVSDLSLKEGKVRDRQWQESVIKFIKKAKVPIVPIHFLDGNSSFYYMLGLIDWKIRLLRLPREVINKGGKLVRVAVGNIISVDQQQEFSDLDAFGDFLRQSVYSMPTPDSWIRRSEL